MSHPVAAALQSLFLEYAKPADAAIMEGYMKGVAPFFGIKAGPRRELQQHFRHKTVLPRNEEMAELAQDLFALPQRELHYAALEALQKTHRQWRGDELALFESLIITKSWWDTVDTVAVKLVAPFFLKFPAGKEQTVQRWIASPDMWLRRTAIIFQNPYKARTDETLLYDCIRTCAAEKEFFIRKGIGWALREYAKTAPGSVARFVETHELSPLSRKEAMKGIVKL